MKRMYVVGLFIVILSLLFVGCFGGGSKGYSISGVVKDGEGNGIAGVKLALEGGKTSLVAETGSDGSWSAKGLQGTVKVQPVKEGWSFDPPSLDVTKESKNVNFTGTVVVLPDVEYDLAGVVVDGLGIGIEGVEIELKGTSGVSLRIETASDGSWKADGLKGTVDITPAKEGWFFNPQTRRVSAATSEETGFIGVRGEDLVVNIDGSGTVRREIVFSPLSLDPYPRTTEVLLTAEPDFDWFFYGWEGDIPEGSDDENPITIVMDGPKEITAVFRQKTWVNGYIGLEHAFPRAVEQMKVESGMGSAGNLKTRMPVTGDLDFDVPIAREGEEIIRFSPSMSRAEQEAQLRRNGYEILDTIEVLNAHLARKTSDAKVQVATEIDGVLSTEPNFEVYLTEIKTPNDQYYGPFQSWHYEQIRLPQAWTVTTGDKNVRVAVVDTGISTAHPDLISNVNLELGASFVIGDDFDEIEDTHGHGSHVSGTIGAVTDNGTGMAGIMWDVEIIPVKVFGPSGRASNWEVVSGMLYAAGLLDDQEDKPSIGRPADIINMSLGGPGTEFQYDAVMRAVANDVILIAATGNEERNLISYPAQYDEVIAVGATGVGRTLDGEPELAYYSNTGMAIDVVAPGGGIIEGSPYGFVWSTSKQGGYTGMAGTSMATPHVSGVVGLMLANGIPKSEVRDVLRRTSMEIHTRGFNDTYGYGLINAYWAVNAVEDMQVIQGIREGNQITAVAQTTVPSKGEQFRLELVQGDYQLIAWVDVNNNGVVDTSDYYTETPILEFGYGEGWNWWGDASEIGEMDQVPIPVDDSEQAVAQRVF